MFIPATYFIETFGCQMNKYDSALVESVLNQNGMMPANSKERADFLLLNTCCVRKHAENRVFSLLQQYRSFKETNPGMKIVLLGCMASQHREELLHRFPHLDLVVGPDGYRKLPQLLLNGNGLKQVWIGEDLEEVYNDIIPAVGQVSAYVAVMRGCNNYCSYCIVPYVRGPERSRPLTSIVQEMEYLATTGIKEVTFLGQNVNSYHWADFGFDQLLREANRVEGIVRIRFLTSHPKDLSDELLSAMSECEKVAPHLHLPLQSGNNRILNLMNRNYTREHYMELSWRIKSHIPEISITTDIIVGFPSESEGDFAETLELMERVHFDEAFTYRYSPRPGTKAAEMADDVPEEVKIERLERLISLVRKIGNENRKDLIGGKFTLLLECESKKDPGFWMGRTEHNRIAVIPKGNLKPGDLVDAKVVEIKGFTLRCSSLTK